MSDIAREFSQIIVNSNDVKSEPAKQCIIWIFQHAAENNQDTALVFPEAHHSFGEDVIYGIHGMNSSNGTTHINKQLTALGIEFDVRSGWSSYVGGQAAWVFPGERMFTGYANRVQAAKHLDFDMDAIQSVPLLGVDYL